MALDGFQIGTGGNSPAPSVSPAPTQGGSALKGFSIGDTTSSAPDISNIKDVVNGHKADLGIAPTPGKTDTAVPDLGSLFSKSVSNLGIIAPKDLSSTSESTPMVAPSLKSTHDNSFPSPFYSSQEDAPNTETTKPSLALPNDFKKESAYLDSQGGTITKNSTDLTAEVEKVDTLGKHIESLRATIDPSDAAAVKKFDGMVNDYNTKSQALQPKLEAHNKSIEDYKTRMEDFNAAVKRSNMAALKSENDQYKVEADKANSPLGLTTETLSNIGNTFLNMPKAILESETNPNKDELALEKQLDEGNEKSQENMPLGASVVTRPISKVITPIFKAVTRFFQPIFQPFADDVSQNIAAGELHDKYGKMVSVKEIHEMFPALQKSNLQVSGDMLTTIAAVYFPNVLGEGVTKVAGGSVRNALISGMKQSVPMATTFAFGNTLASGEKDPVQAAGIFSQTFAGLIVLGGLTHGAIPMSKAALEKATKDIIETHNLPKTLTLEPGQIKDFTTPEQQKLINQLGLSKEEYIHAFKNGLTINIPTEKVFTKVDKPIFAKIKNALGMESSSEIVSRSSISPTGEGGATPSKGVSGLLMPGEKPISPILKDEVKAGVEAHGEAVVSQEIQKQFGIDSGDADQIISQATRPESVSASVKKAQQIPETTEESMAPITKEVKSTEATPDDFPSLAEAAEKYPTALDWKTSMSKEDVAASRLNEKIYNVPIDQISEQTEHGSTFEQGIKNTGVQKGDRKITSPITLFTSESGKLVAEDGQHRLLQAIANGDKSIPAVIVERNGSVPATVGKGISFEDFHKKSLSEKKKKSILSNADESERMVSVYHASPNMPEKGNWKEGTYFADSEDKARYYAESHHRGEISVNRVNLPESRLFKIPSNGNYTLRGEYPVEKSLEESKIGKKIVGDGKDLGKIEENVQKYIEENKKDLVTRYEKEFGNVYNVDNMKELIPGHPENRTISEAFHKPGAKLMGEMVKDRINGPKGHFTFLAGSPGAGKTMATKDLIDQENTGGKLRSVIDGTLASDRSLDEMRKALTAGHTVDLYYVESSPQQVLKNVIKRAQDGGRTVPIETVYNAFLKSRQNAFRAQGKFGENPNFNLYVVDNTEVGSAHFVEDGLDFIKNKSYTKEDIVAIKKEAYTTIEKLHEEGKITKKQYEGFTRRKSETPTGESKGGRAVREFDGEESKEESRQGTENSVVKIPDVKEPAIDNASMNLNMEIIPGLSKTIIEDVIPGAKNSVGNLKKAFKEISTFFNPVGAAPKAATDIIMKHKGEFEHDIFRLEQAVKNVKKMWDKQPEAARLDFMDKIERGEKVSPKLEPIAKMYRDRLDASHKAIIEYKEINFLENFFPHFWEDKDQAGVEKTFVPGMMSRRPLQGPKTFLKERVFENIKEGIKAGYKLRTSNPEELMQIYETNVKKFVMAQKMKTDLLEKGFWQYVPTGETAPENFVKINDAIASIYYKENKTLTEFFDQQLTDGLNKLADNLGIKHQRLLSFKGKGKRGAAGLSMTGKNEVWTKFGSPEYVLMHELGHQIDERYKLKETLVNDPVYKSELRALADKRMGAISPEDISPKDRKYIHKGEEKMAVMFEAYLHAPEIFKSVAPKTYDWFVNFMSSHDELRPILSLKPSLEFGANKQIMEGPMIKAGEYHAQKDVARLINNYLSKDYIYDTAVGTGIMNLKNTMNAFQLGFSAFHLTMETLDSVVTKFSIGLSRVATGHIMPGLADMGKAVVAPYSFFRDGQKFFNNDPVLKDIEKEIFTGGASLKSRQYYKNTVFDNFTKNIREGNFLGAMFRAPMAAIEGTMRPLFSYYIPRLKVGAFRNLYAQQLEQFSKQIQEGKMTQEEVARKAWNNIENRMGEVNYDNLFWTRTQKTAAMLMFRAVGWNLGTLREIGGAVLQDLPREGFKGATGKGFEFSAKMSYTLSLFFVAAVIGGVYEYLHTGHGPDSAMDLFYPKNGAKDSQGGDQRIEFPTYLKDLWQYSHQPIQTVANKFAPEFSALIEVLRNKDFYGNNIRNENDNLPLQAKQLALFMASQFEPFAVANVGQQLKGKSTVEQNVESFFGIVNAPAAATQTDWQKALINIYTDQVGASGPKTPEQEEIIKAKQLAREQIKSGHYAELKDLVAKGIIKPEGVKKFIADAKLNSYQRMYEGLSKENKAAFIAKYGDQLNGPKPGADGVTPEYSNGQKTSAGGIINTVWTYAQALGVDPVDAFHDIFSGQTIRQVAHDTIIVNRMSFDASEGVKTEFAKNQGIADRKGLVLDHIVPLEAGGTNDKDNLQLVPADQNVGVQHTVENFLGQSIQNGTLTKAQAREFAIRFKAGTMKQKLSTKLMDEYVNKYNSKPMTADEILNYKK